MLSGGPRESFRFVSADAGTTVEVVLKLREELPSTREICVRSSDVVQATIVVDSTAAAQHVVLNSFDGGLHDFALRIEDADRSNAESTTSYTVRTEHSLASWDSPMAAWRGYSSDSDSSGDELADLRTRQVGSYQL